MSSKRSSSSQSASSNEPPPKKSFLLADPVTLGPVSTEEELDIKVLKFQNSKLWSRLEEKNCQEEEFKSRCARLDSIRENDQNVISTMNLAWNQLDEDVSLLLQRFKELPEEGIKGMSETTVAFLEKLSNRTSKGMKEEISKRVNYSGIMIKRLVLSLEKVLNRSIELSKLLHTKKQQVKLFKENKEKRASSSTSEDGSATPTNDFEEEDKQEEENVLDMTSIELAIRQENAMLKLDNKRLHESVNELHDKYQTISSESAELEDKLATAQKENTELHAKQVDMQYDLQKATKQFEKLIRKLNESHEQAVSGALTAVAAGAKLPNLTHPDDVKLEMEEKDELAKNRLAELEKLQDTHQKLIDEHEKMKQKMYDVPEDIVMASTKYKILQTQFNLLYNDSQIIRKNCEDARKVLVNNHSQHLQQIDQLENENSVMKKRVRGEVVQLEKALSDSRKELEVLRVEYEHNMKAHEQIAPMAKEMRHLINSLQNHNQQLKGEVARYKKRLTDADTKIADFEKKSFLLAEGNESPVDNIDRIEVGNTSPQSESSQSSNEGADYDDIRILRTKLKSAREKRKEMKLLLDMYKGVSKETRDKVELLKNEKTLKDDVEMLKAKLMIVTDDVVKQSKKFADDDHNKQCRKLEGKIEELQKSIANMKQEEDALLGEMEFTGQAFEEMQDQNIRLMQQLREKDDSNLKLMSERIKSSQIQKILREEKEVLTEQVSTMNSRHTTTEEVIKRLEDHEKVLQSAVTSMESEVNIRLQANECHKRKSVEIGSQYQELIFKSENVGKHLEEVKKNVLDKTNRLEEETFKYNRIQEENLSLKKKLERAKKMEYLGASDEILVEEVKMYKGKLTCPCCNTRAKDAILTKCFHVFCFECLKTRYDTRQRKCPKCNATFGNNDFHKIYM